MRKKRVILWSLLCGVCLVGGASYLSKTEPEPLKAAEKTTATKTEKTAPAVKAAETPAVVQPRADTVPWGPLEGEDAKFNLLPNFNFAEKYSQADPTNEAGNQLPAGYSFTFGLDNAVYGGLGTPGKMGGNFPKKVLDVINNNTILDGLNPVYDEPSYSYDQVFRTTYSNYMKT